MRVNGSSICLALKTEGKKTSKRSFVVVKEAVTTETRWRFGSHECEGLGHIAAECANTIKKNNKSLVAS